MRLRGQFREAAQVVFSPGAPGWGLRLKGVLNSPELPSLAYRDWDTVL